MRFKNGSPLSPPPFGVCFFFANCTLCYIVVFFSCAAVSVVLKERRSKDSVTLAWQGPQRPNGVIVEYEVIYYEKVKATRAQAHT